MRPGRPGRSRYDRCADPLASRMRQFWLRALRAKLQTFTDRVHLLPKRGQRPPLDLIWEDEWAKQRRPDRPFLFGEGQGPFQGWSKARGALDRRAAAAGHHLAPWRFHDLRRTVATRLAELGMQPHVIEAVLNHVSGHKAGVAGIYNRALYAVEKRQALDLWGGHVRALAEGTEPKVV